MSLFQFDMSKHPRGIEGEPGMTRYYASLINLAEVIVQQMDRARENIDRNPVDDPVASKIESVITCEFARSASQIGNAIDESRRRAGMVRE